MLFMVVGTPWKTPRSSRLCCPDCGVDGWFGGKSSTRTATLRMRLRNSCGSESSASSTILAKCSRFILHPLKTEEGKLLRFLVRGRRRSHALHVADHHLPHVYVGLPTLLFRGVGDLGNVGLQLFERGLHLRHVGRHALHVVLVHLHHH